MLVIRTALLCLLALAVYSQSISFNDKLLFRYDFETNPPTDSSTFLRGTAQSAGTPTLVAGKFGQALQLNPGAKQTDILYIGQYALSAPFSITAWFNLDAAAVSNTGIAGKIISYKAQYNDAAGFEVEYNGGKWTVLTPGGSNFLVYNQSPLFAANTWHHIAVTFSSNQVILYLDGVQAGNAQTYSGAILNRGKDLTVGGSATLTAPNNGGLFSGSLDEFRIYGITLSSGQVSTIYNENVAQATAGSATPSVGQLGQVCKAAATVATPSLQAVVNNIPKDSNGNPLSIFPINQVTLHNTINRVDHVVVPYQNNKVYDNTIYVSDNTVITITNKGTKNVTISSFAVDDASLFQVQGTPGAVAAGQSTSVSVKFVAPLPSGLTKTILNTKLHVLSDDSARPSLDIQLSGLIMAQPEGGNEVPLQTILNAFGLSMDTQITYLDKGIENLNTNLLVDEIVSELWQAADSTKDVQVIQIAAFGGITDPANTHSFFLQLEGSSNKVCAQGLASLWAQTIWPSCSSTSYSPCLSTCTTGTTHFTVNNDDYSSNYNLKQEYNAAGTLVYIDMVAFRFWPARNLDGSLIPNTVIVTQDYSLPKGCCDGDGCANCDYQDNVWIMTNVKPADAEVPVVNNLPYSTAFSTATPGNVVDANGFGLPFTSVFSNLADNRLQVVSYRPDLLSLNTASGTYTITTTSGSPLNGAHNLINALTTRINPGNMAFAVATTVSLNNLGAAYAGLLLGSDQKNFALVYIQNGMVYATVQLTAATFPSADRVYTAFNSTTYNIGSVALPTGISAVTLGLSVDPVAGTVSAAMTAPGGVPTQVGSALTLPGYAPGIGVRSAGRLWGYGVGFGPVAWNDIASGTTNVAFTGLAADYCGASATTPTASTNGNGSTSTNNQVSGTNTPSGTSTNSNSNGNSNGNNNVNTNPSNQVTRSSAAGMIASLATILAVLLITL